MDLEHVGRVEARTLKANVTEILRQSIIDGTLPPGAEFNQAQIAERLGVSRGPIREALGRLEQEGLVQSIPYKGVFVTPLTRKYVEELYSVRIALELLVIDRSVERLTADDVAHLDGIIEQMRAAGRAGSLDRLVDLDLTFHEYLIALADHDVAFKMWKTLEVGVMRCLRRRHRIYTFLDEVVGSHPTLVTAMAEGDKALARQILQEHIAESLHNLLANWPTDEEAAPDPAASSSLSSYL